jgi:N5-hydroxy-L-ornithine N5-transacylase
MAASKNIQLSSLSAQDTLVKLPHPYQTEYAVVPASRQGKAAPTGSSGSEAASPTLYQLVLKDQKQTPLKHQLHNPSLYFSELADLKSSEIPPQSNNSGWARARRSPSCVFTWDGNQSPTLGQAWLLIYATFIARPGNEIFRLELRGDGAAVLGQQLKDVFLAVDHPVQSQLQQDGINKDQNASAATIVALRSAFWQGAGSPFGPRPVWLPTESPTSLPANTPLSSFPLTPLHHTMTRTPAGDPASPSLYQQCWHPVRPAKPAPKSVVYSRWIPHLQETFSMVAVDYQDAEHLRLFNQWQNDPRVSQGWNETGTLDQHREYLRRIHVDPHQIAVFAAFDDALFAYFEIYWAKVSYIPKVPVPSSSLFQ